MSMLTVATHFESIGELAEGLADRVEDGRIVLYGPNQYEEGDSIGFEVLLADGTPALKGRGMVVECVDGGDERDPDVRFDVTLGGLDMDGASEAVFERMREQNEGAAGGFDDEATKVASADEIAAAQAAAEPEPAPAPEPEPEPEPAPAPEPEPEPEPAPEPAAAAAPEPEPEPEPAPEPEPEPAPEPKPESLSEADDARPAAPVAPALPASAPELRSFSRAAPTGSVAGTAPVAGGGRNIGGAEARGIEPPTPPGDPGGFTVALDLAGDALSRPVRPAAWAPTPSPRTPGKPSTGLFQYGGAVPLPTRPTRPGLDPSQRVERAPAAMDEEAFRKMREAQGILPPGPDGGAQVEIEEA